MLLHLLKSLFMSSKSNKIRYCLARKLGDFRKESKFYMIQQNHGSLETKTNQLLPSSVGSRLRRYFSRVGVGPVTSELNKNKEISQTNSCKKKKLLLIPSKNIQTF